MKNKLSSVEYLDGSASRIIYFYIFIHSQINHPKSKHYSPNSFKETGKTKLKLSIPFLFLKLEKELTWNGKDWFKAIRADIERGRKGNWSEMFVRKD